MKYLAMVWLILFSGYATADPAKTAGPNPKVVKVTTPGIPGKYDAKAADEKLKHVLKLNAEQAGKLDKARQAYVQGTKPMKEKIKQDLDALEAMTKKKTADADYLSAIDTLKKDQKALDDETEKQRESLYSIMTPAQRAKFILRIATNGRFDVDLVRKAGKKRK
jgi:Spy/CpxP family protein refolding chaperone